MSGLVTIAPGLILTYCDMACMKGTECAEHRGSPGHRDGVPRTQPPEWPRCEGKRGHGYAAFQWFHTVTAMMPKPT
jgi:hypothetical protein